MLDRDVEICVVGKRQLLCSVLAALQYVEHRPCAKICVLGMQGVGMFLG